MNYFKKFLKFNYILAVIFIIGVLCIFRNLFLTLSFNDTFYEYTDTSDTKMYPDQAITQTFTASQDNLTGIKVAFNDLDTLQFKEKIILEIADSTCQQTLRNSYYSGLSPRPYIYNHFRFDPITDSANQEYCLKLTYLANEKRPERPLLETSESEIFTDTSFTNSGREKTYEGESLIMQPTYSQGSVWQNIQELINRISQYKPWFIKGGTLLGITGIFLIGTLALAYFVIKIK